MDIRELTDLLVDSSENYHQSVFIPWWMEDYENFMYKYHIMDADTAAQARKCLEKCERADLLSPEGKLGLTLFHLVVWHNFYDVTEKFLAEGKITDTDINITDHEGHGLTALMLACARGNLAMARLLLEHGADDSLSDDRGMNAYHFLAYPRFENLDNDSDALDRSVEQRGEIARLLTCDINAKNAEGLTPLEKMLSTSYCSSYTWTLPEIFLEKGASTGYTDENGNTLLMMARRNGHNTAALQLMKHCPELLNTPNNNGITPVLHAIDYVDRAMYIALIDHGADPVPFEQLDLFPLSQITENAFGSRNDMDSLSIGLYMAEKMIRQTDPDDDDEMGELISVLQYVLGYEGSTRILDSCTGFDFTMPVYYHGDKICLRDKCLTTGQEIHVLQKMADMGIDLNKAVVDGKTPANILASCSNESQDYLEKAASFFSKDSMEQTDNFGQAAIHLAAQNGHTAMLRVMIEKGADVNLTQDAPAKAGITPLHAACANGHGDTAKLLIDSGADDTLKSLDGETPAHLAVLGNGWRRSPEPEQAAELLKQLKHLDIPRDDGRTPLMLLGNNAQELLPILLERGADVNRKDDSGMTALMIYRDKDIAKLLLQAGADINMADNEGNTALHHALLEYSETAARYLVKKGADYNCHNNEGETPVQLAVERRYESLLDIMTDIL